MATAEPIGGNALSSAGAHEPNFARMPKASSESSAGRRSTIGEANLENAGGLGCIAAFNLRMHGTLMASSAPEKVPREVNKITVKLKNAVMVYWLKVKETRKNGQTLASWSILREGQLARHAADPACGWLLLGQQQPKIAELHAYLICIT